MRINLFCSAIHVCVLLWCDAIKIPKHTINMAEKKTLSRSVKSGSNLKIQHPITESGESAELAVPEEKRPRSKSTPAPPLDERPRSRSLLDALKQAASHVGDAIRFRFYFSFFLFEKQFGPLSPSVFIMSA